MKDPVRIVRSLSEPIFDALGGRQNGDLSLSFLLSKAKASARF